MNARRTSQRERPEHNLICVLTECLIHSWEATIKDLSKEVRGLTLKAVLMGVGALLCFAAAAFIPGGSEYPSVLTQTQNRN